MKPGSETDKIARERCTSIYIKESLIPKKVLPMLPEGLCNKLCSLNPNENKLTFSVFFKIKYN